MADTIFRAGGIVSGFDTNSIIDQLTKLKQKPLDDLRSRQSGIKTQVSLLGDIKSKLTALNDAVADLGDDGALGVKVSSTNTAFSAEASASSIAGRYDLTVTRLAQAARALSTSFASTDTVTGGTLDITIDGTLYSVAMSDGDTLSTVAANINATGAPLSAVVLNDGTSDYLSFVNRDTGFAIGSAVDSALQVVESYTGGTGKPLGLTVTNAINAKFSVNGLSFDRRTNVVDDAVPGTTLTLKSTTAVAESLLQVNDTTTTNTNLTKFVTAYNDVVKLLEKQLRVGTTTDRNSTLAGNLSIRTLRSSLSNIVSGQIAGLNTVRSLVDLGIKTDSTTGLLSIDNTVLTSAINRDADAVNTIFSTDTVGIQDQIDSLVDFHTNSVDGILTTQTKSLNSTVRTMDTTAASLQARIEKYKLQLVSQFAAMEKIISGLKSAGNFLAQQSANTSNS